MKTGFFVRHQIRDSAAAAALERDRFSSKIARGDNGVNNKIATIEQMAPSVRKQSRTD
jgi:hypothetical protein